MTLEHVLVLGILTVAVVLFVGEWLRVDLVALLVMCALLITNLVTPTQAVSGFSNRAVVTVWAVFIISGGLFQSGVADSLSNMLLRLAGHHPARLTFFIMLTAGLMSAVMNNIGAVAILMPAVSSIARQTDTPQSKLLMPLAFAALLGGNITLIGTPPNLLANTILEDYGGVEPFAFFDFAPVGAIALVLGIIYMLFVGRHLLPVRIPPGRIAGQMPTRDYVSEVAVTAESSVVGMPAKALDIDWADGLALLAVQRDEQPLSIEEDLLRPDDVLALRGSPRDIVRVCQRFKLRPSTWDYDKFKQDVQVGRHDVIEVTLSPDSTWRGATLRATRFRDLYGLTVLAIRHHGRTLVTQLGRIPLDYGDSLLVEGPPESIDLLRHDPSFLILEKPPIESRRLHKAPVALVILLVTLVAATVGIAPVETVFLIGATAMVLSGALTMDEAYHSIDWRSVFLIAGMLPLGIAMEETGTAALLADSLINLIGDRGPLMVLTGMFLLTSLLTAVMSNAAATVLIVPIAIDAAFNLGVNPQPFVMATVLAASNSFILPVGHQVNIIILGASGYKVADYIRVGVWLNLIMLLVAVFVLPLFWPF